jgi:MoxR-like ATPase
VCYLGDDVPQARSGQEVAVNGKVVVIGGKHAGQRFAFSEAPILIGSDEACAIRLTDRGVQPNHASIDRTPDGGWLLASVGDAADIEVRGQTVNEVTLEAGLVFRVGGVPLRFETAPAGAEDGDAVPLPEIAPGALQPADAEALVAALHSAHLRLLEQVGKVIVGQRSVIEQVLVALFAQGHCLLIGVPGLGKTLLVRTLASALDLDSCRIQFTPDLMPADITGTDILEEDVQSGRRVFRFNRGPVFTNVLLADEINRTPPKTQAALLEAMQERRVTAAGTTYDLPSPFLVLATQNPIELEGTYPLPEAQLDRFMFAVRVDYPLAEEEVDVLLATTAGTTAHATHVLDGPTVLAFQQFVREVPVSRHVAQYTADLIRASRPGQPGAPAFVNQWVRWGAGPRAGQCLLLAAKAHAVLAGRFHVSCADVRAYAQPVLRHRLFRNFAAVSDGIQTDEIVTRLLEHVKEPAY